MNFRTQLSVSPSSLQIDYQSRILSMGSCFADRMGKRLASAKFPILINPLGIAYNPVALADLLLMAMGEKLVPEPTFSETEEVWQSLAFHSRFNHTDKAAYQQGITQAMQQSQRCLQEASVLILTLGTAMVYRRQDNQEVVNNCHRFPRPFFSKELLSLTAITDSLAALTDRLQRFSPRLKILLTVSPVRHIKDSLPLNAVSKASLRLACHELSTRFSHIDYFPAYEIMMDDLRDYRYYQDDLIHPTDFAEQYIWETFVQSHLRPEAQQSLQSWQQIKQDLSHRPRNPHSAAHRTFLEGILEKLRDISGQIDCAADIAQVEAILGELAQED